MDIEKLLDDSLNLENELLRVILKHPLFENSQRLIAVLGLSEISVQHSSAMRHLMKNSCHTSSFALYRLQYESLVKALWTFYIAADKDIEWIIGDLNEERVERNNKGYPVIAKMLDQLLSANTPANQVVLSLIELKNYSWKALNSYVHSGLHAVYRNLTGYPEELIFTVIRQSNNLLYISAYLLAIITDRNELINHVSITRKKFTSCFQLA